MNEETISSSYAKTLKEATDFLYNLCAIRSYSNEEQNACEYVFNAFSAIKGVKIRKLWMDNSLKKHPLWCSGPYGNNEYDGHFNIEAIWEGSKERDPVYLNAHIDTVPVSDDYRELLIPRLEGDILHGLGACDDKGGIASIYTVFKMLSDKNVKLPFDVIGHIVVEEEIGGNGALAATDRPLKGQAAVILEPTAGVIKPIHRNGLWIKITCEGCACHTGSMSPDMGITALDLAIKAIYQLKATYAQYIEEYKAHPIPEYEGYIPMLNVGMLHIGDWPSKVPDKAVAIASVPVLPDSTNDTMKRRIAKAFGADEDLRTRVKCEYVFDRGSSVLPFDHPLVKEVSDCAKAHGYSGELVAQRALCDKYFYQEIHGIPTVTFGPGDGRYAHSAKEHIDMNDVVKTANAVYDWISGRAF